MAIINSYPNISTLKPEDLLLVSDTSVEGNPTKTAPVSDIVSLIPDIVPGGGTITEVIAGFGLTGGGTSGAVTLNIGGGDGIDVNSDNIEVLVDNTTIEINGSGEVGAITADIGLDPNALANGNQIAQYVTGLGYSTVEELNDLSDVLYSSRGLFVGEVPAGVIAPAQYNVSLGDGSLFSITEGRFDTAIGNSALASLTTGINNTAVGGSALGLLQTGNDNTAVGYDAGGKTEGNNNVFLGKKAGYYTNEDHGVFIGYNAGLREGAGSVLIGSQTGLEGNVGLSPGRNTFLGYRAGYGFGGSNNIFIGHEVAANPPNEANSDGSGNIGIGVGALYDLEDGDRNIAIGQDALKNITSGNENFAIGYKTGESLQFGDSPRSTFIGHYAGQSNGGDGASVAIGYNCLNADTNGVSNVAIGKDTLALIVNSGSPGNAGGNVAIGVDAGNSQTSGEQNTYVGNRAAVAVTASSRNTIIGHYNTDPGLDIGNDNTLIGANTDVSAAAGENQIVIGSGAIGHGDNIAVIGNSTTTSIDPHNDNTTSLGTTSHGFTSLVLVSPNGTKFTITVNNAGALVVT